MKNNKQTAILARARATASMTMKQPKEALE
jgi:hypothetical protein